MSLVQKFETSVMHLKLKHFLTAFLSFYRLNAIQMHKCKINVKKIAFGNRTHYGLQNGSLGFIETHHKL